MHMQNSSTYRCFLALALLVLAPLSVQAEVDIDADEPLLRPKVVMGWLQNVRMYPGGMLMKAKLDSGALSNAIHAENIDVFEQEGQLMVSFTLLKDHQDPNSQSLQFELPVEREVAIKLRQTSNRDIRPVVMLGICMAGEMHEVLFSLTARADFNYPVLLGRNFLKNHVLIDSSETFTHRTTGCPRN
jgi:hypothetical protein